MVSTERSAQGDRGGRLRLQVGEAIIRRYNARGPASVADGHRTRPGGPQVAAWVTAATGRATCPQVGWVYLQRLGHTLQAPRPQHSRAAPSEERAAFKQSSPPR